MKRAVLIHGNGGGTGGDNWFPWLKTELEKLNIACLTPDMPDPIEAKSAIWLPYLKENLNVDEDTILVGHSSGALAAMRYAESNRILGSVLVGAAFTDLGEESERVSGYFDTPWNWQAIKQNQKWMVIFASTDDPYIGIEEPRFIRDELGAEYYEFQDQGHFGEDKAKVEFPEILTILKTKLGL